MRVITVVVTIVAALGLSVTVIYADGRVYMPISMRQVITGDLPAPVIVQPTYTPLPTYTPYPTFTPVPVSSYTPTLSPTRLPSPTNTLRPVPTLTPTLSPSRTPSPTRTATPTHTPEPTPTPIILSGRGKTGTDAITIPWRYSVAEFTHNGRSNFIVHAVSGNDTDYLVNEIGVYKGRHPLEGDRSVFFDVTADGAWTITISQIGNAQGIDFNGRGDSVGGFFDPPAAKPWNLTHDGRANFIVHAECEGGTVYVVNEIGAFDGSTIVRFDTGPCYWTVQADGTFTIKPR